MTHDTNEDLGMVRWKERALHAVSVMAMAGFFLHGLIAFG
jgi:hypothetical protein